MPRSCKLWKPLLGFTGAFPGLPTLPEVQRPTLNHAAPSPHGTASLCACTHIIPLQPGLSPAPLPHTTSTWSWTCFATSSRNVQLPQGKIPGYTRKSQRQHLLSSKHCVPGIYCVPSAVLEASVLLRLVSQDTVPGHSCPEMLQAPAWLLSLSEPFCASL